MRTTRSTQALAQALRQKALARLPAVESLDAELNKHAAALGLDGARPRIVTSRIVRTLLAQLSAASDPTANLRVLAAADLPRENAIYRVHIDSAVELTGELRGLNWRVLDEFATSGDPQGTAILAPLRDAARREEHEIQLARPL